MTDDLIERVARAMFDSCYGGTGFGWDDQAEGPDLGKAYYRRLAVAAIDVMRGAADDGARNPTCGDLSPSINFGGDGDAERFMCELAFGHGGAHEHDNGDGMPPMRWVAHEADDGAVGRVLQLAEEWRYKGEFGWGPWQRGEGPDIEGQVLDEASARIRAAVGAPATTDGDDDAS